MVRTKVFVGNLSFTTKENELAKEFEVAGKVISANIITRGPRSLGYGFVEMDNETDAENAVKLLDKKEIDGRPINVEVAKPREEGADDAQAANAQGFQTSRGGRGGARGGATRGAPRGGRGGAPRGAPREGARGGFSGNRGQSQGQQQQGQGQQRQQGQQQQQGQQGQGQQQGGARRQFRRQDDEDNQGQGQQPGNRRAPRPPRAEGEDNRTPSTTTLFVANLPFSLEDETFEGILKGLNLPFKSAHVVKKRTGRSKGFGFIEFDTQDQQKKALDALNNKDVEGRPLAVKIALTEFTTGDAQPASTTAPAKVASPAPAKNAAPAKTADPAQATVKKEEKPATPKTEKK